MNTLNKNADSKKAPKDIHAAFVLPFFLGPVGMLYSTLRGALIMLLVHLVVGLSTMGFGLIFTWPIGMVWTIKAAGDWNSNNNI